MVDCKICKHPYCEYAGMQRGFVVDCNNYMPQAKVNCNQLCGWNDPSDGCVKPSFAICKMSNMSAVSKPITNGDRWRARSDEELAEVIDCPYMTDIYDECKFGWHEREHTCFECKLEWLKQPAEDK